MAFGMLLTFSDVIVGCHVGDVLTGLIPRIKIVGKWFLLVIINFDDHLWSSGSNTGFHSVPIAEVPGSIHSRVNVENYYFSILSLVWVFAVQ